MAADTLVRRTIAGLDRVRGSITPRCAPILEAEAHHHVIRELADTVAGTSSSNELRMRLSAFVLAARLEKVATLANERLAHMGEGRSARHTDGLAARARAAVSASRCSTCGPARRGPRPHCPAASRSWPRSPWPWGWPTPSARRPAASTSDAFVDEGFGTLDDEGLEEVMAVLDDLR